MTTSNQTSQLNIDLVSSARIQTLDILRGAALMGILIVHCVTGFSGWFFASPEQKELMPFASLNPVADDIVYFLFADKSRTLFAFMFGVSFFLQLQKSEQGNLPFKTMFLRRLGLLMILGIIHAHFMFGGDILRYYAVGGLLLLLVFKWPSKWLISTGLLLVVGVPFIASYVIQVQNINIFADFPPIPIINEAYQSQSFYDNLWINHFSAMWRYHWFFLFFFAVPVTGVFLFGIFMASKNYLQRSGEHLSTLKILLWCGIGIGFFIQAMDLLLNNLVTQQIINATHALSLAQGVFKNVATLLVTLGYVCGITLLCQNTSWLKRLSILAPAGRMTLTNYVMQSILGWFIFYGSGLGLYLRVGPVASLMIAFVLCAFQLIFSAWWLRHYNVGPLEWVWRWAVQGKRPAIKQEVAKEVLV